MLMLPLFLLDLSLMFSLLLLLLQHPLAVHIPLELADVIRILSEHSATLFLLGLIPSYLTRLVNIILVAMAVIFGGVSFRIQVQPVVVHHKLELLAYLDLHVDFEALQFLVPGHRDPFLPRSARELTKYLGRPLRFQPFVGLEVKRSLKHTLTSLGSRFPDLSESLKHPCDYHARVGDLGVDSLGHGALDFSVQNQRLDNLCAMF